MYHPCPQCGRLTVRKWWAGVTWDPGDVEPRAQCLGENPSCNWGY